MASFLRKYISLRDFKLQHGRPADFVHSVVCASPIPYAIGVTCISIHAVTMAIYSGFSSVYGVKILIWLTYWSFFALTARFLVTAFNVWTYVFRQRKSRRATLRRPDPPEKAPEDTNDLPTSYKVQWALQNISSCSAMMVSGLYWTILYKAGKIESERSVNSHALNAIFVLADLLLSRAPVRIHHFVYTFLFVLAYIFFTVVYWAAGGQNHKGENFIYSLLDYSGHPGRAVLVVFAVDFVGTPLLQIVLYALFRLRQWVCSRFRNRSEAVTTVVADASSSSNVSKDDKKNGRYSYKDDERNSKHSDLSLDEAVDGPEFRGRNYTLTSNTEDEDAMIDVDLDFEMDEIHVFRPVLQTNTSQVSCTDSTKALLN